MNEGWEALDAGEDGVVQVQAAPSRPTGLREAREAAGMHIAALAATLKVPVKKLEALESGNYGELPDLTFARALASSACRHLRIDAGPVLEMIPHAHAPTLGGTADSVNAPFKPDQGAASFALFDRMNNPAFKIAGVVLLAALGLAVLPDWSQWPGKDWLANGTRWVQELAQPSSGSVTSDVVLPTVAAETDAVTPAEEAASASEPVAADLSALKSATGLTTSLSETATAAASSALLRLEATDDSWVEVVDGAGKVQIQRVMKKGDVLDFSTSPPYSVVLGRADAVNVQVRGQPFDVAPFARNSVARFPVK